MRGLTGFLILILSSTASAQATFTGYVRDSASLRGLGGAEVTIDGSDRKTRSEKDGKFALRDLPGGLARVHVRLVGFAPVDTVIQLAASSTTENVFFLAKPVVRLDSVVTTGQPRLAGAASLEGMAERKKLGLGKFIDSVTLRQNEHRKLPDLLADMRDVVTLMRPGSCNARHPLYCDWSVAVSGQAATNVCTFEVIIDNAVVQRSTRIDNQGAPLRMTPAQADKFNDDKDRAWGTTFDLNSISVGSLAGVEVYRNGATAPGTFTGESGCGVLVLWLRH